MSTFYAHILRCYLGAQKLQSWTFLEKICSICFCTKNKHIEFWWNWHHIGNISVKNEKQFRIDSEIDKNKSITETLKNKNSFDNTNHFCLLTSHLCLQTFAHKVYTWNWASAPSWCPGSSWRATWTSSSSRRSSRIWCTCAVTTLVCETPTKNKVNKVHRSHLKLLVNVIQSIGSIITKLLLPFFFTIGKHKEALQCAYFPSYLGVPPNFLLL